MSALDGVQIILTPVRAPNANAVAERWIGTVRAECLDRLLIVGRQHLVHVFRVYTKHYNGHCPHRALGLRPDPPSDWPSPARISRTDLRRDMLGGLVHEHRQLGDHIYAPYGRRFGSPPGRTRHTARWSHDRAHPQRLSRSDRQARTRVVMARVWSATSASRSWMRRARARRLAAVAMVSASQAARWRSRPQAVTSWRVVKLSPAQKCEASPLTVIC